MSNILHTSNIPHTTSLLYTIIANTGPGIVSLFSEHTKFDRTNWPT